MEIVFGLISAEIAEIAKHFNTIKLHIFAGTFILMIRFHYVAYSGLYLQMLTWCFLQEKQVQLIPSYIESNLVQIEVRSVSFIPIQSEHIVKLKTVLAMSIFYGKKNKNTKIMAVVASSIT